jgi:hypothetical protein
MLHGRAVGNLYGIPPFHPPYRRHWWKYVIELTCLYHGKLKQNLNHIEVTVNSELRKREHFQTACKQVRM